MSTCQSYIILGLTLLLSIIATVHSGPNVTELQVKKYLSEYGYLPASSDNSGNSGFVNALKNFQNFANTNVTGELDEPTKKLLLLPRCGLRDKDFRNSNRLKRFAIQGSYLRKNDLTYNIEEYSSSLPIGFDTEIHRAFLVWSEHIPLNFTRKYYGKVDIQILFVRRDHGDGDQFDGRGKTLAHAFFPQFGSEIHFDAEEQWTIGTTRGTNLFQIAVHEIGHALGLKHSDVKSAVMAPFYRGYDPNFKLDDDDIAGIQFLYGKRSFKPTALKPTSNIPRLPQEPNKELCDDPKIDAIFETDDDQIYVFKGEKYYKLAGDTVADGYPKLISDGWPGLPGDIDAAFAYKNGKTYFFKDTKYWRFTGSQMDDGYPKKISEDFPGVPAYLDAAMYSELFDKIYFFKGRKLWQLDSIRKQISDDIHEWEDIPGNLDAAFVGNNGFIYFFKDHKFYKVRHIDFPSKTTHYPRSTRVWWFGCS